jgi:hypothetical protein
MCTASGEPERSIDGRSATCLLLDEVSDALRGVRPRHLLARACHGVEPSRVASNDSSADCRRAPLRASVITSAAPTSSNTLAFAVW